MQGYLAIHSGCLEDAYPVWQFSAAPSGRDNCLHWNPEFELNDEEWLYCLLWAGMNYTGIERVLLEPYDKKGRNQLNLYLCALKEGCYLIGIDMDFGRHSEHPWLLSQLAFQQQPAPGTISALHHSVIKSVGAIMHCLNRRDSFPAEGEYFQCDHKQGVFRQTGGYWTYNPAAMPGHYPFAPWLYHGPGLRILPLSTCYQSRNAGYHRCNSYLFQSSDYSGQPLPTGLGRPVLHIGFDYKFRDYQQQYLKYDLPGIGEYFKPVNYAELLLAILFSSPQMTEQIAGSNWPGFAQNQYIKKVIKDVEVFNPAAAGAVIPVKSNIAGEGRYSAFMPGDIVEAPGEKHGGKSGKRSSQDQGRERHVIPGFAAQAQNNGLPKNRDQRFDDGPPNPELPPIAPPAPVAILPDVTDLLSFLQHHGLFPTQFPVSPSVLNVLAQSDQPMVVAGLQGNLIQQTVNRADLLYHPLIRSLPTYLFSQISSWWGFRSNLDSHIALLSELLNADVAVLIALQPGQHLYRRYSTELKAVFQGRIVDYPDHFLGANIILVQSPSGFIKVEPARREEPSIEISSARAVGAGMTVVPEIPHLLPVGTGHMLELYQSWPWVDGDEQASQMFNRIALGNLHDKDRNYLNRVREYLALKGHISFPLKDSLETGLFRFSKTLLEWIEQFWEMNHEILAQDNSLFFDDARHRLVVRDIRRAAPLRRDLSIGFAREDDFSPIFVDAALPVVKLMADQQKFLMAAIASVVNQFFQSGVGIACYGGMAKRSHLVQRVFAGNLAAASEEGALLPVNDVDLMMFNLPEMELFLLQLVTRLRNDFPWLSIVGPSNVPTGQEHLTTRKIILYWQKARFFTIDVSHSRQYGYFDFTDVAYQSLFIDPDYSPTLPLIGFSAIIRQLVQESFNNGDAPDSERRSYLAKRFLWLLKDSSPYISELLSKAYPEDDWQPLFHSVIYGVRKARVPESPLPDDDPDDSGHESAGEDFELPAEPDNRGLESPLSPEDAVLPVIAEPESDELVTPKPGEQKQEVTVVIEEKTLYPESLSVAKPFLHDVERTVNKQWSASVSRWHIPPGRPSLTDAPVVEPVQRNPFSNPKLLAALNKIRFPEPVAYKKVHPDILSETKRKLEALHNRFLQPATGVITIPQKPSELGDYFSGIDPQIWRLSWVDSDLSFNDDHWFIPSLPVSVQGKLWLWSALHKGGFFQTGGRLQIIQKVCSQEVMKRLQIAMSLGNHIAGYLINVLDYYQDPDDLAYYDILLRRAAPFVPEALNAAVHRMVDVHSRRFDPEGIVKLVRQAVISKQETFSFDLIGEEPVSKTVLAIIEALKILPEDHPSQQQQEEAASWLLQELADQESGYRPAIIGIMLMTGLESFLPEDWRDMCAKATPRGQWVCSWAYGGNTPELNDTPAWYARHIRQNNLFSHKEAVAQFQMPSQHQTITNLVMEIFHSGDLLFNTSQWLKGLSILRESGETGAYRYLVNLLGLFDPQAAAARIVVRDSPAISDRVALGSVYEQLRAGEDTRSTRDKQQRLARLYPALPESQLWSGHVMAGERLTTPDQLGYSFEQAVLTPREQELRQHYLPSHPEFGQLSEKLVFSALAESGARVIQDNNQRQIYVDPQLLAIPHIFQKLQNAAYLNNPEAGWLVFLSGRTDLVNPLVVELKLAAKAIPAARQQTINLLLAEGPWFDPEGLLTLYREAKPVSTASVQRVYATFDNYRDNCLILDQYLQAVANAQSERDRGEAWRIIASSPALKLKRTSILHPEVIVLLVSGQLHRLDKPIRDKLKKQLKGKSPMARYLASFLSGKKGAEIVKAMNEITGDSVDPGFLYEEKSRKNTSIKGIKAAALARKLAVSEEHRTAFADELARLQNGSLEQKEMARYWLYRVMYTSRFLFNHALSTDLAQKIYRHNKLLGLLAFGAILSWHSAEYPGMVLRRVLSLNQEWEASPSEELRSVFTTGYLNFLVDSVHDERLTDELRALYSKAMGFIKKSSNPALRRDVDNAEQSYSVAEVNLQEQLSGRLKYTVEWCRDRAALANIKIKKLLELLPELEQNRLTVDDLTQQLVELKHPVGLFMYAWLHWQTHQSYTAEIRYRYLYPAARQFLPAMELLFQEVEATDLSALMVERVRLGWENMDSTSAGLDKWNSKFQKLVERSPDDSLLNFLWVVNRAPAEEYRQKSQNLPPPLVSQIHTAGVMKYFNRLLDAVAAGDIHNQHEAAQALDQAIAAFNAVGATARKTLFSKLTDCSGAEEALVSFSPHKSDDRILQLSGYLNLNNDDDRQEQVARMLIEAVALTVGSEQELGWALGWLPLVQQRYRGIPLLLKELQKQGKYTAIAELFEAVKDWSVGNSSELYLQTLELFMDFMVNNHQHFSERLEAALEYYLAERIQNEHDQMPFVVYRADLVILIHSQVKGDLAVRLHEVIDRYASYQMAN